MDGFTIREVAQALGWKKSRIEKMISRKEFIPENYSKPGVPYGRSWTLLDVLRLKIFDGLPYLGSGGRSKAIAEVPLDDLQDRFIVVETLSGPMIRREVELFNGQVVIDERRPDDVLRVVRSADVPNLLKNPWAKYVHIVSLQNVEAEVRAALSAIRPIEAPGSSEKKCGPIRTGRAPKSTPAPEARG